MTDKLIHFSSKPLSKLYSMQQEQAREHRCFKPNGLWFSVGDEWHEWCRSESFGLDRLAHRTEIIIRASAKILRLQTADDIDAFSAEFGCAAYSIGGRAIAGILWPEVALRWQGVIIAPYCWERRLSDHTIWYYGWDCASGCIWDAAAVQSLKALIPVQSIGSQASRCRETTTR